MRLHPIAYCVLVASLGLASTARAQSPVKYDAASSGHQVEMPLGENGEIPAFLVAGPFEEGIVGFGQARDDDLIGEADAAPVEGQSESSPMVAGGEVAWQPVSSSNSGYMDFMEAVGWTLPSDEPEKVWKAKVAYAFATLVSDSERDLTLWTGSNSSIKVLVNGETVLMKDVDRAAVPDADSTTVHLQAGFNRILVKVGQTHRNEGPSFFGGLPWQWGFFARLTAADDRPPTGLTVQIPAALYSERPELLSTFFFKDRNGILLQRFDLVVDPAHQQPTDGTVMIIRPSGSATFELAAVPFGQSRHELWLPAVTEPESVRVEVRFGDSNEPIWSDVILEPQPHYEIHLAMMSHTDIGYTNIQPVVKERHIRWLDEVIARCAADSSFKWTIETVWQLEQYRKGRPKAAFNHLMDLVREGRIAISPIYSNPFTGWVSNEEMLRAFDAGRQISEEFGLTFPAAVYNDVPGLSWIVPEVLKDNGVGFLATGINEVYGDYPLQRNLPKAFVWEGPGGGRVVTYRNEAYNEGQQFGLEKDTAAVAFKTWERLNRLKAQGSDRGLVLAIHTFGDNGPIPLSAAPVAEQWDATYAWPRFVISTIDEFAKAFIERYGNSLPTLRGDWTSTWDVQYQGEPDRMIRERWTQNNLPTAEKMATIAWLQNPAQEPLDDVISRAYDNLLQFSGHGSGLEYGYGSPRDNLLAMEYREQYVTTAELNTVAALERALFRLSTPEESFEGEALYVFNPLNWRRDAIVEFEFPRENGHHYRAVDIESGQEIPFFFSGHTLRFVARDLPPLGFKKIRLQSIGADVASAATSDLALDGCSIENAFYRIVADCAKGVEAVIDRRNGKRIAGAEFATPVLAEGLGSVTFESIPSSAATLTIVDERPVRLAISIERPGQLFSSSTFDLYEHVDAVGAEHTLDLTKLEPTDEIQEYSARFEFDIDEPEARVDVTGGILNPEKDRFPGVDHDLYSVRKGATFAGSNVGEAYAVDWAPIDSRVMRLRTAPDGRPVVLANLVNNFPEAWNRWESNDTTLRYRFAIRGRPGSVSEGTWDFTKFGWEQSVPAVARYTWLRSAPAAGSFLDVEGNVVVTALRRENDGLDIHLFNPDTERRAEAKIGSGILTIPSFDPSAGMSVGLLPGEIKTVRLAIEP